MIKYHIPKKTPPSDGRRIAIGDIHGCFHTFKALLQQLSISPSDQIFLLGDLIDKGKYSKELLDFILTLIDDGFQIFPIKGNHEYNLFIAYECGTLFFVEYLEKNNIDGLLETDINQYLSWIDSFEYAYDLGDFLVCHTPFLSEEKSLYRGMRGLFPKIDFVVNETFLKNTTQIVGHVVHTIEEIKTTIRNGNKIIPIDSGCVYKYNESYGYLTAFDMDAKILFFQKNIDE